MITDVSVSATIPDWSREEISHFWDAGPKLIRSVRRYQAARTARTPLSAIRAKYWVVVHRFWSIITQTELHLHMPFEGGLLLPHPTGIIVHPDSRIGPNCLLFHQVTLAGAVTLGGHVDVGAGAKLLGPITIGDDVKIGANAVVTKDVPSGTTVIGIPAREVSTGA